MSRAPSGAGGAGVHAGGERRVHWTDLGRQPYALAWELQRAVVEARKAGAGPDRLLVVEHEPVVTLGRRARPEHVRVSAAELARRGVALHEVERGGDVTYHGPGQLVAYPVLDLSGHRRDVRWYGGALAEVAVRTLAAFDVRSEARDGPETGVWVRRAGWDGRADGKVASLGMRIERWVTSHGLALNVDVDPSAFDLIVPCGLVGVRMVSVAELVGRPVTITEALPAFLSAFAEVFAVALVPAAVADLPAVPLRSRGMP